MVLVVIGTVMGMILLAVVMLEVVVDAEKGDGSGGVLGTDRDGGGHCSDGNEDDDGSGGGSSCADDWCCKILLTFPLSIFSLFQPFTIYRIKACFNTFLSHCFPIYALM